MEGGEREERRVEGREREKRVEGREWRVERESEVSGGWRERERREERVKSGGRRE